MEINKQEPIYHYVLDQNRDSTDSSLKLYKFGKYFFHCSGKTAVDFSEKGESAILIFGDVVHTKTGKSWNLAEEALNTVRNIDELLEFEKDLGGKYLILYKTSTDYFLLPDATCSIPVYYCIIDSKGICSDLCEYIASRYGFIENRTLRKVRDFSDISQAMPYNRTTYSEILALLPNHYLSFSTLKSNRIINSDCAQEPLTSKAATKEVLPRILTLTNYYISKYNVCCPITGGRDSRVVLALLTKTGNNPRCYTIVHNRNKHDDQDYTACKCDEHNLEDKPAQDR